MKRANDESEGFVAGAAIENELHAQTGFRLEQQRFKSRLNGSFRTNHETRAEPERLRRIETELQDLRRLVTELTANNSSSSSYLDNSYRSYAEEPSHQTVDHSNEDQTDPDRSATSRLLRIVLVNPDEATASELVASSLTVPEEFEPGSIESLEAAIAQRDGYIVYLSEQLRDIAVRVEAWLRLLGDERNPTGTQAALYDAQDTVSRILKLSEVELSVERAKLARERAQLEAEWQALENDRHGTPEPSEPVDETASPLMRRWDRFFPPLKSGRQT